MRGGASDLTQGRPPLQQHCASLWKAALHRDALYHVSSGGHEVRLQRTAHRLGRNVVCGSPSLPRGAWHASGSAVTSSVQCAPQWTTDVQRSVPLWPTDRRCGTPWVMCYPCSSMQQQRPEHRSRQYPAPTLRWRMPAERTTKRRRMADQALPWSVGCQMPVCD